MRTHYIGIPRETFERLRIEWSEGRSPAAIAAELEITEGQLRDGWAKLKLTHIKLLRLGIPEDLLIRKLRYARERYNHGEDRSVLAKKLGINPKTLSEWWTKYGIDKELPRPDTKAERREKFRLMRVRHIEEGVTVEDLAAETGISANWIYQSWSELGLTEDMPIRNRRIPRGIKDTLAKYRDGVINGPEGAALHGIPVSTFYSYVESFGFRRPKRFARVESRSVAIERARKEKIYDYARVQRKEKKRGWADIAAELKEAGMWDESPKKLRRAVYDWWNKIIK